ncbi:unnamed protein product [Linum tenue]|uniref:Uncharacterized protein n=1 Tax=Linum tenue TaxID=586396 RepID=A0AAV0I1T0_9ROSI|nr:unnamed protein product [Linum tenue]
MVRTCLWRMLSLNEPELKLEANL